jgi:hypothetical protein
MASLHPLIRLPDPIKEAIWTVVDYIARSSGTEPTQEELAQVLQSYFTLDEVANQLNYLRRRPEKPEPEADNPAHKAPWRFNMRGIPLRNSLLRAGWFTSDVAAGIASIRRHAGSVIGSEPSDLEIAQSLTSSFILSELKNQILHARHRQAGELDLE